MKYLNGQITNLKIHKDTKQTGSGENQSTKTKFIHTFDHCGQGRSYTHGKSLTISNGDEVTLAIGWGILGSPINELYNHSNETYSGTSPFWYWFLAIVIPGFFYTLLYSDLGYKETLESIPSVTPYVPYFILFFAGFLLLSSIRKTMIFSRLKNRGKQQSRDND